MEATSLRKLPFQKWTWSFDLGTAFRLLFDRIFGNPALFIPPPPPLLLLPPPPSRSLTIDHPTFFCIVIACALKRCSLPPSENHLLLLSWFLCSLTSFTSHTVLYSTADTSYTRPWNSPCSPHMMLTANIAVLDSYWPSRLPKSPRGLADCSAMIPESNSRSS